MGNKNIQTKFKETEIGSIPEEWEVVNIGNILTLEYGKALKEESRIEGEIPVYGSNGVVGYHNQKLVNGPGIIIGRKGSAGEVIFSKKDFFPIDTTYFVKTSLDNKYVYYLLKNTDIKQLVSSSAVPGLNRNDVYFQQIGIPKSEQEQKQIAEILFSLDDKIELNRQINANLEKIASSLFKHWFIDFEFPDKNSKPYKSSGGKMIDSELGEIPEGWKVELLTNYVDIGKGLSYKGSDLTDKGKDVLVGLKCFERGGGFRADGTKRFAGEFKNQHLLNQGDLIIAMTDLTQGAEVLGKPAIVPNIKNAEHIVASLDVSILRPKNQQISKAYLYTLFMRQETQDYLFGYSNGSTVLHLSVKGLNEFKLAIASNDIFQNFNNIIEPIFDQIQILNDEIINLSQIRDSLLPRLMNGKIRVKI